MVTTHDERFAEDLKVLCLHGISKDAWNRYTDKGNWFYEVLEPGFKYNLSDIQSAIGIHQLRKLDGFIEQRRRYAQLYNDLLGDVEEVETPPDRADCRHAWHLYTLRLNLDKLEVNRDEFINALRDKGVGTSVHFIPIALHPYFSRFMADGANHCPRALELYPRLISLPLYPGMEEEQVVHTAQAVKELARTCRKSKSILVGTGGD